MTKLTIRIDFENGGSIGPGKVRLLEAVESSGSIRGAAASCGMSFRQGWLLLRATGEMFGEPLTETVRGGSKGGGTRLTPLGDLVVSTYRKLEEAAALATEQERALLTKRLRNTSSKASAGLPGDRSNRRKSLKRQL